MFRYCVYPSWREVLSHDADGNVLGGSLPDLVEAFSNGSEVKAAVGDLCSDLAADSADAPRHEVFVRAGSCYYYTQERLFIAGTHPVVRAKPAIPMRYETRGWDFGWLMLRTDGQMVYRRCDPYTLKFNDVETRHPVRWFVR